MSDIWKFFRLAFLKETCFKKCTSSKGRKEANALFNDTFKTFYLRLYGIGHMIKYSDSDRNLLLPYGLLFPISSKGFFYTHHPIERRAHTIAFVIPVWSTGWNVK